MNQVSKLALIAGAALAFACGEAADSAEGGDEPSEGASEADIFEAEATADAGTTEKGIDWGDLGVEPGQSSSCRSLPRRCCEPIGNKCRKWAAGCQLCP